MIFEIIFNFFSYDEVYKTEHATVVKHLKYCRYDVKHQSINKKMLTQLLSLITNLVQIASHIANN